MDIETFGLNEQHQHLIQNFLKFNKLERQKHLKFIELSFQDVVNQMNEATYTKDEVEELFEQLKELVSGEITSESISTAHMNVLLLTQMLVQAEKWHLAMTLDFSEIQNRELLEKVKILEDSGDKVALPVRLQPLDDNIGPTELLRHEIERLQRDNERLNIQLSEAEAQLNRLQLETEKRDSLCTVKDEELSEHTSSVPSEKQNDEDEKQDTEQLLGEYDKVLSEQLSVELESMRMDYLRVQSQLTLAEQELEKKFNETVAYSNMKAIIANKNDQVKELRNQLNNLQQMGNQQKGEDE